MRAVRLVPWFATLLTLTPRLASAQAPAPAPVSALERSVDPAIAPGDDFFGYANGAWLHATTIPAGKARWGIREEINGKTRDQITQLLTDAERAPAGSLGRKVADYRAAYLDEGRIERAGLTPLRPLFDSIAAIHDKVSLARFLGAGLRADVDPLNYGIYRSSAVLGFAVEQGLGGEGVYLPFLVQGGLGLPDREPYLSTDGGAVALRATYLRYIARMLATAGVPHADQRAQGVLALETALASSQATPDVSSLDANATHRWTRADFAREAPGMDWTSFFAAAGLPRQDAFIAWQPGAITGVAAQVAAQPLGVWQDYLKFHLLDHYSAVLPRAIAMAADSMHLAAGAPAPGSREDRARDATLAALSDAMGQLYTARFFPAAQKARIQRVVANVAAAFTARAAEARWMAPDTRTQALTKLRTLYVGIGYPERWPDLSALVVDRHDALGNLRRVEARAYREALAQLGRPVDRSAWLVPAERVGALLSFQQNAYDFSAALLQPPKYDSTASDAATYGAIGAVIGHDVTHYVDRLGADYDTTGAKHHWWPAADSLGFEAAAAPLVAQYSAYRPLPDAPLDGTRIETEEVADLGGLVAAFDAYRRSLGDRVRDTAYVRAQDREFFLAFAQSWRSTMTDAALREVIRTDIHAPDRWRVAIVRNLDAWYDAFDVRPGQQLYLAPSARVRVW